MAARTPGAQGSGMSGSRKLPRYVQSIPLPHTPPPRCSQTSQPKGKPTWDTPVAHSNLPETRLWHPASYSDTFLPQPAGQTIAPSWCRTGHAKETHFLCRTAVGTFSAWVWFPGSAYQSPSLDSFFSVLQVGAFPDPSPQVLKPRRVTWKRPEDQKPLPGDGGESPS